MTYQNSNFPELNDEDDYPYCPNWKEAHYNMARLGPRYYPVDVFKKFDTHRRPIEKYMSATAGSGFFAFSLQMFVNWNAARPIFASFHRHIAATLFGMVFGYTACAYAVRSSAREQSRLLHYMESHPEYFPPIQRFKYKDTLGAWNLHRVLR